jgi:hypothetical protein
VIRRADGNIEREMAVCRKCQEDLASGKPMPQGQPPDTKNGRTEKVFINRGKPVNL